MAMILTPDDLLSHPASLALSDLDDDARFDFEDDFAMFFYLDDGLIDTICERDAHNQADSSLV